MAGHVFIVHGDLRRLACDAWLLPTDAALRVEDTWRGWPERDPPRIDPGAPSEAWRQGRQRVQKLEGYDPRLPQPWLVNVSAKDTTPVSWFVEAAALFLDAVAHDVERSVPRHRRSKRLVALPVVGTRFGGAARATGDVVRALLPVLDAAARRHDFDVALVAVHEPMFAAAESERKKLWLAGELSPDLTPTQRACADALAEHAVQRKLVLFLGAGVSIGAGLPAWTELLEQMGERAGLSPDERRELARFDAMDQASIVRARLEQARGDDAAGAFHDEVVRLARATHASLSHMLMAAMPVEEIVTTNYDELFEVASAGIKRSVSVLPHAPDLEASRWLLKLHGCVSRPEDIVLTREDFLRYEHRRAALAGIVQALLITKHMLFVGFSLKDENFHRIADAVRRARGSKNGMRKIGTVLRIESDALLETLWNAELDFLQIEDARHLEIFLDYLLATTRAPLSHILDPRYRGTHTEPERALAERLQAFLAEVPASAKEGPAWEEITKLVQRFGGDAGPR